MSFILDALKKSELERQRQTVPGLMDAPSRRRRKRLPVWAIALGALLIVNLAVLTVVLMRRSAPAQLKSPSAASGNAPASAASAPAHFSPMDSAPVYAPEIPVASEDTPEARDSSGSRAPMQPNDFSSPRAGRPANSLSGEPEVGPRSARRQDPLLTDTAPAENDEVLPTVNEMSLTGSQTLPELHLDIHVYATRAAERFVYINMRKYHEGAVLQEGPTLERIRRDGVVLNDHGLRFILPRQP